MKNRVRNLLLVVMPFVGLSLASCGRGDGPPLYPVHGKVMYKGEPAAGATVILRRQDAEPNTTPLVPAGQVDDAGDFTVAVDERGDGAPAGKYAVLIQWRKRSEGGAEPKPAPSPAAKKGRRVVSIDKPELIPDRLEGRFMNPDTTPFHVEVKPGENNVDAFDITKAPAQQPAASRVNKSVSG